MRGLPHGPVAKTSPFNAGDVGLILGWGAKISQLAAKKPKHKTGNTVTSSMKTLKIVHIKKKFFFKENDRTSDPGRRNINQSKYKCY